MSDKAGAEEYYAVLGIVKDFDKNLLVVKGWGATVSTVTLAAGFEKENYGIFLVAAPLGEAAGGHSTPQIDWSWTIAPAYLDGKRTGPLPAPQRYQKGRGPAYLFGAYLHVMLPHAIAVGAGAALFLLGSTGRLSFGL